MGRGWARVCVAALLAVVVIFAGLGEASAQTKGSFNRRSWYRNGASLDMDFANNRYMISGTVANTSTPFYLGAGQAFVSRASSATYVDVSGVVQTVGPNVARTGAYDLGGGGGTLIEPASTNYISNSLMTGSVAGVIGSGGALPTEWGYNNGMAGLSTTVVTSGTEYGMRYIELNISGTVTAYSYSHQIQMTPARRLAVSLGQNAMLSYYLRTVSGSLPAGLVSYPIENELVGGVYNNASCAPLNQSILNATLRRYSGLCTVTQSTTDNVVPFFGITWSSPVGSSVNFNVRVYGPQLEYGSTATSYIPASNAITTRAADMYSPATPLSTYTSLTQFIAAAGGTFSRNSSATYVDSAGVIRTASANVPRLDYDPSLMGVAKGILIEEGRTNLLKYSTPQATYWSSGSDATATYNADSDPAGTSTATVLTTTGPNRWMTTAGVNYAAISVSTTYTYSVYLKAVSGTSACVNTGASTSTDGATACFTLSGSGSIGSPAALGSGTYVGSGIQKLNSGWYRVWVAGQTASTTQGAIVISPPVAGGSLSVWGAQIELGSFPTSYIPTSGSAVTRAVEQFSLPAGSWFNASTGTWFAEHFGNSNTQNGVGYGRVVCYGSGSCYINFDSSLGRIQTWSSGLALGVTGNITASPTQWVRSAMNYDEGSLLRAISLGGNIATGSYTGTYSPTTSITIGNWNSGNSNNLNSPIKRVGYFPLVISGTALQDMTR